MAGDNIAPYYMRPGKGKVLIFVNDKFTNIKMCPEVTEAIQHNSKKQPWQDAACQLDEFWTEMGYPCTLELNKSSQEIEDTINNIQYEIGDDDDCLILAFITYGDHGQIYGKDRAIALQKVLNPLKTGPPHLREVILYLKNAKINIYNKEQLANSLTEQANSQEAFGWLVKELENGIEKLKNIKVDDELNDILVKGGKVVQQVLEMSGGDVLKAQDKITDLNEIKSILEAVQLAKGKASIEASLSRLDGVTENAWKLYRKILDALDTVPLGGKPKIVILQTKLPELHTDDTGGVVQTIPSEADFFYIWSRVPGEKSDFIPTLVSQMYTSMGVDIPESEREITTIVTRTIQAVEEKLMNNDPDWLTKNQELPFYMSQLRKKLYLPRD